MDSVFLLEILASSNPMLLSHLKITEVSIQLVIISGHTILSVVLEVVGQTIIKEHRSLWRKTESQ